jgi:hypothetical protein
MRKVKSNLPTNMTRIIKFRYNYNGIIYPLRLVVLYQVECGLWTYGYSYTIEKVLGYDNDSNLVKSLIEEFKNSSSYGELNKFMNFRLSKKLTLKDFKQSKLYYFASTLTYQFSKIIHISVCISVDCIDGLYDESKYTFENIWIKVQPYLECYPDGFDEVEEDWCEYVKNLVRTGIYNYELVYKALNLIEE